MGQGVEGWTKNPHSTGFGLGVVLSCSTPWQLGAISRGIKHVKICKCTHFVAPYFKLDTSER